MSIKNKYFKIGETLKDDNKTMKVVKSKYGCTGCFYDKIEFCSTAPSCMGGGREDNQNVIFKKI